MHLNSYNPHNRYRERAQARVTNAISMLLVIALSACIGFWMGKQYGVEQNISLEDQVESLTKERNTLQSNVTELRAEAQTANTRYEQIKAPSSTSQRELCPEQTFSDEKRPRTYPKITNRNIDGSRVTSK